jgi:hypothetical protein
VKLTTHQLLVPRLRMRGATPLPPPPPILLPYLVKHQGQFHSFTSIIIINPGKSMKQKWELCAYRSVCFKVQSGPE